MTGYSEIEFIEIGGPYGDQTCSYEVRGCRGMEMRNFVKYILESRPDEWGFFETRFGRREYEHGKLLGEMEGAFARLEIESVVASGGWTRMDYKIKFNDYSEIELKSDSKVTPLGDCRFRVDGRTLRFAIRKLTPRECFRLMDVDEADINKIQAAGISNSQQYKLAGNSIVVACLEKILEQLYYPKAQAGQLSLF